MNEGKEQAPDDNKHKHQRPKRRRLFIAVCAILILLLLILVIVLVLALTVFKLKQPRATILSATVQGVAPRISFPAVDIQLNITLDLQLLVENRNHFSFKRGHGKSLLLYQEKQVGEADLIPGMMPAMGSTTLPCRLTLHLDEFASNLGALVRDVMSGQIVLETQTKIPGRITFLEIFKRQIVATSKCQLIIAFPSMKVKKQDCKSSTKF